ncbi:MAG: MATE family efflux transporter, partial [Balneolaceae bacterium]|nr:MATE family efflux transporter [Balneolaceae bacterium]
QVSSYGALRGLKDTTIPMYVNLFAYWVVGLPLGYFLGITQGFGPQGLWMGLIAGLTVAAIFHNMRFFVMTGKD